jgi:hypothetical protein
MPKMTLLEVVNAYMDATDGFPVTSISGAGSTYEAQQVASIAKVVFYEVVNDIRDWKFQNKLIQLEAVSDPSHPNYLKLPDNCIRVQDSVIRYNTGDAGEKKYKTILYMPPHDFIEMTNSRDESLSTVDVIVDFGGAELLIRNDVDPTYWTTFDDKYIVFDSYNSNVDSTLQASKSQVYANVEKVFELKDDYTIDLPEHFIPTYLSLVKARASEYLREEPLFSDAQKGKAGLWKERQKHYRMVDRDHTRIRRKYGRK